MFRAGILLKWGKAVSVPRCICDTTHYKPVVVSSHSSYLRATFFFRLQLSCVSAVDRLLLKGEVRVAVAGGVPMTSSSAQAASCARKNEFLLAIWVHFGVEGTPSILRRRSPSTGIQNG